MLSPTPKPVWSDGKHLQFRVVSQNDNAPLVREYVSSRRGQEPGLTKADPSDSTRDHRFKCSRTSPAPAENFTRSQDCRHYPNFHVQVGD